MLTLLREMSVRLLVRSPLRSALVVLGIAFGVAIFVGSEATSASMLRSFQELAKRVTGGADLTVIGNEAGVDGRWVADLAEMEGVAHAAAALEISTQLIDDGSPILVMGVDFLGDTHFLPFQPSEGEEDLIEDPLAFANDPTALLITRSLAKQRKLALEDELSLLTSEGPKAFTVKGILDDEGPAASFGGRVVVMFLDAAQVSFARDQRVDRIDIAIADGADVKAVQARLADHLKGKAEVIKPERRGDRIQALIDPLRQGLRLSGYVALLVGMFIIYNAIGVSVAQRRRELGLLRALGVLRRGVLMHFCLEAALLAIPGSLIGLFLGQYLMRLSNQQTLDAISHMYAITPETPTLSPMLAMQGMGAGILMSVAAAYLPARRGARMDPVEALRVGGVGDVVRIPSMRLLVIGLSLMVLARLMGPVAWASDWGLTTVFNMVGGAMCAPALVLALRQVLMRPVEAVFGVVGRLGLDNVQRNLGRSSINVLALWVAVSMSIAVGGWLGSFEHAVRAWFDRISASQLSITAGSPLLDRHVVPLSEDALRKLEGLEGIRALQPLRRSDQLMALGGLSVIATDVDLFLQEAEQRGFSWEVLDGPDPIPIHALTEKPRTVLSENAARRLNVTAGDSITLETVNGPLSLEVLAVVVDFTSERGAAFIDRQLYIQMSEDHSIDAINVYLQDGADPKAVAEAARQRLAGGDQLFVTETAEVRDHFLALLARSFSHVHSLELIVLFIALFGVVGTLIAAVLDRVREIGMLRAIGTSRAQITVALVLEASFLGLCATLGGIASGTAQCLLFLETVALERTGWHLAFIFPWEPTVRMAVLVIGAAALSGLVPGRQAARLEIRDAIAYE